MMAPGTGPTCRAGERIGPYRIVGELGGGGMGVVYRAVHTLLQRPAAIKVLRPELGRCASAAERFHAEACATAAIRHPGVVEVYDFGYTEAGHAFIAMELLEGQTLGARLAQRGRASLTDAMGLARRIAAPLAAAHEQGVVHRDLKPDNVFLVRDRDGSEQVKLLDFGVAKLASTEAAERAAGEILGTPAYMSPEQCLGSADCDQRTDLYALGCILFELLTGLPPYGRGRSAEELVVAHVRSPVPALDRALELPPEIERLVARLLAKRVEHRPGSALEVAAEIDRWLAAHERTALAPPGVRRFASRFASGLASSIAVLGSRVRAWRCETMLRGEPSATAAPTADGRWSSGSASDPLLTHAPTQPLIELADRAAPAAQLAGN